MESEWFDISTGVKKGDVVSPLLFIIFMDEYMRGMGVRLNQDETLIYAEDVAVVADCIADLQELIHNRYEGMTRKEKKIKDKNKG